VLRFRGHHCVVLYTVDRLLMKQDNAPVKAQLYSHIVNRADSSGAVLSSLAISAPPFNLRATHNFKMELFMWYSK